MFPVFPPSFERKTASCQVEANIVESILEFGEITREMIDLSDMPLFTFEKETPPSTVLKIPPFSVPTKNVLSKEKFGETAMAVIAPLLAI